MGDWTFRERLNTETSVIPDFIYMGNGRVIVSAGNSKVYKSEDYGLTWAYLSEVYSGPDGVGNLFKISDGVYGMSVEKTDHNCAFYKSSDYGETWSQIGTFNDAYLHRVGSGAYLGISNSNIIYVIPADNVSGTGGDWDHKIYRSTDGGVNWTKKNVGSENDRCRYCFNIGSGVCLLSIIPGDTGRGILFKSSDYGNTWTEKMGYIAGYPRSFANLGSNRLIVGLTNAQVYI